MGGRKPHPNFFLLIGGVIVGVMAVLILVGYVWTPYDTTGMSGADKFLAPCLAHPLGTDNFGRDILSRVMEGAGEYVPYCPVCRAHWRDSSGR